MIKTLWGAAVLALSLCMDCFAVTACSSVTLRDLTGRRALSIALLFSVVHVAFLATGWFLGDLLSGYVASLTDWIGCLLLLYVGGSMVVEAFRQETVRDLNRLRNLLPAAVATSIDAMAVGVSLSMNDASLRSLALEAPVLFVCTFLIVLLAVFFGSRVGKRFDRVAQIAGGCVLIFMGFNILFNWI